MLTLGDKIIAGSFKAGASWEVGDVGISAFGIDEALNKRRYLNGQVISQAQFVEFTAMLKSRVSVYPSLATTEVNWQAEVTNSALGQCGKFVIDDDAGTIRLPKVVNINGLQNLTGLGTIKAESLPNISGAIGTRGNYGFDAFSGYTGAFEADTSAKNNYQANTLQYNIPDKYGTVNFNASRSSSTYQDDAPVQQEAVQYPYFIQVAEGVETSVDVSREIELNNPFSLLDYKYSEYELDNASWLLSNGQWNNGAVYTAVYNLLLAIYNGTETKAGVSVKLSTETYADTDFVLNTGDTTFRLPTKVLMAGSKRVAGNGMSFGLTDGTLNRGMAWSTTLATTSKADAYGANVGTSVSGTGFTSDKALGVTTDETKSGIETSANGLYLYFYVGETVQDANVIAAAGVLTDMTNIKNGVGYSSLGTSFISGQSMPSSRYEDLTVAASDSSYTAPANGWVVGSARLGGAGRVLQIYGTNIVSSVIFSSTSGNIYTVSVPVKKGEEFKFGYGGATNVSLQFIYAEGEPNV